MLRKRVDFKICAFCDEDEDIKTFVNQNLFSTLENIADYCQQKGIEWCIELEGRVASKSYKPKDNPKTMLMWIFLCSEKTFDIIMEKFDDCEQMNYVTYYIERRNKEV